MSGGLPLLATRINQARQMTASLRGQGLDPELADKIGGRLKEAARLLQGKEAVQTGTLRYRLWARDPRCLWCGVETRIDGVHEDDAATLDHLHRRGQRATRYLPTVVLACRRCNNDRGQPPTVNTTCPIVKRAA